MVWVSTLLQICNLRDGVFRNNSGKQTLSDFQNESFALVQKQASMKILISIYISDEIWIPGQSFIKILLP